MPAARGSAAPAPRPRAPPDRDTPRSPPSRPLKHPRNAPFIPAFPIDGTAHGRGALQMPEPSLRSPAMSRRQRHPALRTALMVLGVFLIILSAFVGPLPGPGGIFVFAGGLVLVLQNSHWARVRFARAKRRWPRVGGFADR